MGPASELLLRVLIWPRWRTPQDGCEAPCNGAAKGHSCSQRGRQELSLREDMIYDVNSVLFRSFLASGGGSHGSGVRCSTHPALLSLVAAQCLINPAYLSTFG